MIRAALLPWARTLAFDLVTYLVNDITYKVKTTRGDPAAAKLVEVMADDAQGRFQWPLERFPIWLADLG